MQVLIFWLPFLIVIMMTSEIVPPELFFANSIYISIIIPLTSFAKLYESITTLDLLLDYRPQRSLSIPPSVETDDRTTSDHNNTLLCDIRTIHRISYRSGRRTLVYGVHRARTCDDVRDLELVLTCGVVVLYGEVPEDNRGNTRFTDSILGDHPRIHHGRYHPWYGDGSDRARCSHVFHTYRICSYRTHDTLRIPHITPLFARWTTQLTCSR